MGQKGRKKDVSPHSGRNLRIKFIHEFVCGEMGNQGAMLVFVNNKLKSHGLEGIEKATLQADISYLNSGYKNMKMLGITELLTRFTAPGTMMYCGML
jgi:hypothetical protein